MNKYLIEILKLRTSLTLPGFGALMIANSRTGKIVLNQLLKYDDKVLAKFISEKENIDLLEAQNKVSKFVKEIDLELSKGETYDIFQFGQLTKTENGSIFFEMDESMKKNQDSPIISTPKVEKVLDTKPVEISKKVVIPVVEKKEIEKKETVKPVVKEKKVPENVYVAPVKAEIKPKVTAKPTKIAHEKASTVSHEAKNKVDNLKNKTKVLSAKEKLKKEKEANKKWQKTKLGEDDKTKKRKVWPWILLLLLIGSGTVIFMFQDKLKTALGMSHDIEQVDDIHSEELVDLAVEEDVVVEDPVTDTLAIESEGVAVNEITEEAVPVAIDAKSSTNGNYHIIGGAFGVESNASAFATQTGGTVIGRFDGMYQVAVKSYNTRDEVNSAIKSVSLEYSGAWIFKYPK